MKNERNVRRGSAAASSTSPQHGRTQVSNRGGVTGKAGIAASLPVVERPAVVTDEELTSRRSTVDQTDALDQTTNQVDSSEADDADALLEDDRSPLSVEARQARRFRWPGRDQWLAWAPFWGIILLAAILRFWGLGDRPLHHDESLHAYFSLQLMHNLEHWSDCFNPAAGCYRYNPVLHGPFQFHIIALTYKISQILGVYPNGVNTTTVRIPAALLGTVIVGLPFFLRDYLGRRGALLACFMLAVSPSMVYFSRFAREDIYMACFTLLLVVSLARYVRDRKLHWLILAAVALTLSYATKEATFLTIAIFGSFTVMLLVWELGARWTVREHIPPQSVLARFAPKNASPLFLVLLVILLAPLAKWFFGWMKYLSDYVNNPANTTASDAFVQTLKDNTVAALPWFCLHIGMFCTVYAACRYAFYSYLIEKSQFFRATIQCLNNRCFLRLSVCPGSIGSRQSFVVDLSLSSCSLLSLPISKVVLVMASGRDSIIGFNNSSWPVVVSPGITICCLSRFMSRWVWCLD